MQEKKKRLEEERINIDVSHDLSSLDLQKNQAARKLRKREGPADPKPTKKARTGGPTALGLAESEVLDDLLTLKKSAHGPNSTRRAAKLSVRN